jgi:hypothetical protein
VSECLGRIRRLMRGEAVENKAENIDPKAVIV